MRSTEEERSSLKHKNVSSISSKQTRKINDLKGIFSCSSSYFCIYQHQISLRPVNKNVLSFVSIVKFSITQFLLLEQIKLKTIFSTSIEIHFWMKNAGYGIYYVHSPFII